MIKDAKIIGDRIDPDEYHASCGKRGAIGFVMTRSSLKEFAHCPFKWRFAPEEKTSKALDYGALFDAMVLDTGSAFERKFVVRPDDYPDGKGGLKPWHNGATFCKEWNEANADRIVISSEQLENAQAARDVLLDDNVSRILTDAKVQVWITATWAGGVVEVPIQALIDIAPKGPSLGDLKTAADAHPDKWSQVVYNFWYHVQAALCLDLWNAATGEKKDIFFNIISESTPPYCIGKRIIDGDFIDLGRSTYQNALDRYAQCLKDDYYPGYDEDFNVTSPRPWMLLQDARNMRGPMPEPEPELTDAEVFGFEGEVLA